MKVVDSPAKNGDGAAGGCAVPRSPSNALQSGKGVAVSVASGVCVAVAGASVFVGVGGNGVFVAVAGATVASSP